MMLTGIGRSANVSLQQGSAAAETQGESNDFLLVCDHADNHQLVTYDWKIVQAILDQ